MREKQRHIWVVRHGDRADGCKAAQSSYPTAAAYDPALTFLGIQQAEATAKYICSPSSGSPAPSLVVSSPFLRCIQTAWPLAIAAIAPLVIENCMCEWLNKALFPRSVCQTSYGKSNSPLGPLLGLSELQDILRDSFPSSCSSPSSSASSTPPAPSLMDSAAFAPHLLPNMPGFNEHILSVEGRCKRVAQWLSSPACAEHESIVIVTHGYNCAFLCSELMHPGNARDFLGTSVPECSVSHFVSTPTPLSSTASPGGGNDSIVTHWANDCLFSTTHLPSLFSSPSSSSPSPSPSPLETPRAKVI